MGGAADTVIAKEDLREVRTNREEREGEQTNKKGQRVINNKKETRGMIRCNLMICGTFWSVNAEDMYRKTCKEETKPP